MPSSRVNLCSTAVSVGRLGHDGPKVGTPGLINPGEEEKTQCLTPGVSLKIWDILPQKVHLPHPRDSTKTDPVKEDVM